MIWTALINVVLAGCLVHALVILWIGDSSHLEDQPLLEFFAGQWWAVASVPFLAFAFGEIGRGWLPTFPWRAYTEWAGAGGIVNGILGVLLSSLALLWFFAVPARQYWTTHPNDPEKRWLAIGFNVSFGFLAISKGNALLRLLYWIVPFLREAHEQTGYGL